MLEQVKGVTYNLSDFFGPPGSDVCRNLAQRLQGEREDEPSTSLPEDEYMRALMHQCENRLFFCTIYLGPGDYHRFHAPTDWTVHSRRYFPGGCRRCVGAMVSSTGYFFKLLKCTCSVIILFIYCSCFFTCSCGLSCIYLSTCLRK